MTKSKHEKFQAWFNRKWSEWDAKEGRRTIQQELADYLGITRASVAQYAAGRQLPEGDSLRRIAKKFGVEVYEILGVKPLPDDFSQFPPSLAARLRAASNEMEDLLNDGEFAPNSPEHLAAARDVFARHGLDLKDIEITED
jgi:transcriptional regulator with XRE-family HTH domain